MSGNSAQIDMKQTGKRIKQLCHERGITVKIIQGELNIGAFQSIYNWFSGKTLPSLRKKCAWKMGSDFCIMLTLYLLMWNKVKLKPHISYANDK